MSIKKAILFVFIAVLATACIDESRYVDIHQFADYYPLNTGVFVDYDITQITIDKPSNVYDTIKYQIRQRIDEPFIDNKNDIAWRVELFRKNSSGIYVISDIWSAKIIGREAQSTEENLRIVKIRFPLKTDYEWNGNVYNKQDMQNFLVTGVHEEYMLNGFRFDSVLTITHEADSSIIHKDISYEKYAYGIGLVYKEITHLNSQDVEPGIPVEDRITTGTIYIKECTGYGNDN